MQFQVPQFIDTEDKIVGPLTIRQFAYIAVAGGISTVLYFSVQPWLWLVLSIPLLAFTGALAFAKVNGRPFAKFLWAAIGFYWSPQTYIWGSNKTKPRSSLDTNNEGGFSMEKLLGGMALKKAWNKVQVGNPAEVKAAEKPRSDRYQIFGKITGEHEAAKRVDYR